MVRIKSEYPASTRTKFVPQFMIEVTVLIHFFLGRWLKGLAGATGSILQGLDKPVNDLSRGCSVTDIINPVAIFAFRALGGRH